MISISRSMLLAAALAAFPLAGAMAQHSSQESTGSSSATAGAHKTGDAKNDSSAMKSTAPGYQDKSDVSGGVGKSPGTAAASAQSEKK